MSDHISETVSAGQLRSFVERIERVEEEIKELNADKSDIYKEARSAGFDVKAVRQCVAARKLDSAEREERNAIFDLYWAALTGSPSRVHVHEAKTNSPSPAIAPSPAGEAGDGDSKASPSPATISALRPALTADADGHPGIPTDDARGAGQVLGSPQSSEAVSHFTNPRCERPDTCPNAHSKDTCFDCIMAWAKRPAKEQVMLWQQAVEASRTQAA